MRNILELLGKGIGTSRYGKAKLSSIKISEIETPLGASTTVTSIGAINEIIVSILKNSRA